MSEHYTGRRINVRAIIYKDGKLLAVKHLASDGSTSEYYAVPGGGLDPHESLEECLKREVMEELGIDAIPGKLLAVQQFPSSRNGYEEELEFFYEVRNVDDFSTIDINTTTHGAIELAVCEYIDPSTDTLYPVLLQSFDFEAAIDGKQPTLVVNNLS